MEASAIRGFGRGCGRENCRECGGRGWGIKDITAPHPQKGKDYWYCEKCGAGCFHHRVECFKCGNPKPESLKKISPEDLCDCGCNAIVKHGDCGTGVSFYDIPLEVFLPLILKRLSIQDICSLAQIDKENNSYFSMNEIWKNFFIAEKVKKFIPERKNNLSKQKVRTNATKDWTSNEIRNARCTLVIKNVSSMPMDIYWKNSFDKLKQMNKNGPILKGDEFVTCSYPNHKWICIPTDDWFMKNPSSNVGFAFLVNVLELTNYNFGKTSKLAFVRKIHEPRELKPIKGVNKNYSSVKKEYMKLALNLEKLNASYVRNAKAKVQNNKDIENLRNHMKNKSKHVKYLENREKAIMYAQSVVKQK